MLKTRAKPDLAVHKPVLIVDDNLERCRSLRAALAGYAVETASNPDDVAANLRARRPDVILVDPQLPGPEGLRMARCLLVDPELEDIPIVALFADRAASEQREQSADLFDGYIFEPVDAAELMRIIQALPGWSPHSGKPEKPAARPPEPPVSGDVRGRGQAILDGIERALPESQFAAATAASLRQLAAAIASSEGGGLAGYLERAEKLAGFRTVRATSGFRSV